MAGRLDPRSWDRFWRVLLVIVAVAFAARVAYVAFEKLDEPVVGDQVFYNAAANLLGAGGGFLEPFNPHPPPLFGDDPAADHPPLTVIVLAPVSWAVGGATDEEDIAADAVPEELSAAPTVNPQRFTMAVLGTFTVLALGLLGREVAGDRVGWIAAGIGAVYPNLWVNDGLIMSETLAALTVTLALLFAYRFRRRPAVVTAAVLGGLCGLAALARAELVLLLLLVALPVTIVVPWRRGALDWRQPVAALGGATVLMGPWVVFNMVRFEEPTFLSTNDGIALLGSNCDQMYYGRGMGLTTFECLPEFPRGTDQSERSRIFRDEAFEYMREHASRVPVVALARVGRTWSVFRPGDMLDFNEGEGRERWVTVAGLVTFYPLLLLAVYGGVVLRRRRVASWPLIVPVVIVTVASAATYGQTRFRVPAEPSLVVLAAVALAALPWGAANGERAAREGVAETERSGGR